MRKHALITIFILLVLTACDYDAPLVADASLPIDPALLGTWVTIPGDRDGQESLDRIVIRQESANLYVIEHVAGESIIYFKGWLAELEGNRFMQVEVTGDNDKGPVGTEDDNLFSVATYALDNGELVVRSLNTDLVNTDLADTTALQAAFVANRDDPSLFHEPVQYRKL
jgi:hypothetical protein